MTPEEVKEYYGGSLYSFNKKTNMSCNSLANWLKWGFVPEGSQYKIERLTNGELKVEINPVNSEQPPREVIAFMDLKSKIVKSMFEFTNRYTDMYPENGQILIDVLKTCLGEAQIQMERRIK